MENNYQNYDIVDRIQDNKFLLTNAFTSRDFSGTDTKELFEKNLETRPPDWYYRHNPVTYTINSLGYRADEFEKIDWANSVVVFGCSNVYGVGLNDNETMPYYLSKILRTPVVNMGVGGSSITYALHNSIILRDGYPTPKAVVHMWTGYDRTVYYNKNRLDSLGAWNVESYEYMREWAKDSSHAKSHALFASKSSKWMWRDTKYFEGSYFGETSRLLRCYCVNVIDYARDFGHPGKETQYQTALKVAEGLQL